MKEKKQSIFAVIMLAILVVSVGPAFAPISVPHNADAMWVEPAASNFNTATTSAGFKFNITVAMNITENVFAYQAAMHYNRTQLKCIRAAVTAPPTSEYMTGHATTPGISIDGTAYGNGSVVVAETCSGTDFIPGPHSGTLFWAEFQIMLAPSEWYMVLNSTFDISKEYALTNTYAMDPSFTPITFTPYDGTYQYVFYYVAPPMPYLKVVPASTVLGPSNVTGSIFSVKIQVANMTMGLSDVAVQFRLQYDSAVLSLDSVTEGPWMTSPIWNSYGTFFYSVNTLADPMFGDHVAVIDIVLPNTTNGIYDQTTFPNTIENSAVDPTVATVSFKVLQQNPMGGASISTFLNIPPFWLPHDGIFIDKNASYIDSVDCLNGIVTILPFIPTLPYLKVVPASTVLGPLPVIGSIFSVKIQVANMTMGLSDVAVQFRLQYDSAVLSLDSVTEGPWMTSPIWNSYGTFFYSVNTLADPMFGDHVAVIVMLLPNTTNGIYDQTTFPNTIENSAVDPTVATVSFKVLQQNPAGGANISTFLNIPPFWLPHDEIFIDKDSSYIDSVDCLNGIVTILPRYVFAGRVIDLYGGAVNDGYASLYGYLVGDPYWQFQPPYGGQGSAQPMDIVFPQSQVYLHANVTYNYNPVQSKDVGFEIEGPYNHTGGSIVPIPGVFDKFWGGPLKFAATTDTNGVASYTFRMPWTCPDFTLPDRLTGIYKVTSTVTIADQVVSDTMYFYYERVVYITCVTTDKYAYNHLEYVKVSVDYHTHSIQHYPALFAIVITDELTVPFGMAMQTKDVGGATFCTWKTDSFDRSILIQKWAYAGIGSVHVSVFDKDPTDGGEPWTSEYTPNPTILIYPY